MNLASWGCYNFIHKLKPKRGNIKLFFLLRMIQIYFALLHANTFFINRKVVF